MIKATLRHTYKERRKQLPSDAIESFNDALLLRLQTLSWSDKTYIHTFLPIASQHEPDMWRFIEYVQHHFPANNIVVSRANIANYSMENFLYTEKTLMEESAWGITEPISGEPVEESALDAVIIPLLVADMKGNRVGYGKGFYDRFLAKCRPDCVKIGLSYFEPILEIADVGPFDVPLDMLLTPDNTYSFF
ncbi:5-formyltetrahydrofolate cyclo-ligase [Sphingobacterium deserti]|uniref:5-formyltetrahydrofolate cyclo-ligase n=1 Tax=Sphingobacterium deserti TaxID=1229276 RepID=A0A0B8T0V3_9SPHI|nr:5-formyltetrahydrofolate cyclo-ligase [Sphingobacterium deserti]KGE14131.1 5-formyltetrahydrofolate cyclo-ligase [Sphingobacterium deserti]